MEPVYSQNGIDLHLGDCREVLKSLPEQSVQTCVTSPPYFGLRDYGMDDQVGLESTPQEFVDELVSVFREVRRVLRDDGTLWLNLGDSYASSGGVSQPHRDSSGGIGKAGTRGQQLYHSAGGGFVRPMSAVDGLKPKDLIGIPWRVALALQSDGWYLRQDVIWHKPNPMPESVKDRCTKSHEYIFLLSKSQRYHFDADAIKEDAVKAPMPMQASAEAIQAKSSGPMDRGNNGVNHQFADSERLWAEDGKRNKRSVWTVTTKPYTGAHFATYPPDLIQPCIAAGCPEGGTVLDPFLGSGTTGQVARDNGCRFVGIELNPEYLELAKKRLAQGSLLTAMGDM